MHPETDLSGACQPEGACHNTTTHPSSMVWQLLLLETDNTFTQPCHTKQACCKTDPWGPLSTYSTKLCPSLKKMYSLYSLWMFPLCLSVASEAPLRTRKGCMQLITSHDKKDYDSKTNVWNSEEHSFNYLNPPVPGEEGGSTCL